MPEAKVSAKVDTGKLDARKLDAAGLDAVRPPRTQQQRREETRRALLDAAVESLIEVGRASCRERVFRVV